MILSTLALVFLASSGAVQPAVPGTRTIVDVTPDPRAPLQADDTEDFFAPEPAATPTPAPIQPVRPAKSPLGRAPVLRGDLPSGFATLDIDQAEIPEVWTVTFDGGQVGRLDGYGDRVRVSMIRPGRHTLAIFNKRGTLWSGTVQLRAGQTLTLSALAAGLSASDPMALTSDAERAQERLAKEP